MRVIVCEEELLFLEELKEMLQVGQGIKRVECYENKTEFVKRIKEDNWFDLVFMDIRLGEPKEEEIEFGEYLYDWLNRIPVILLAENNYIFNQKTLLSKLNLIGYLVKPVEVDILNRYIEKAKALKEINYVNISSHGKNIRLQTDEIIHIESHNHKINIFTSNDVYSVYEKISDISERLPKEFIQCHKSFIVNLKYVVSIDAKHVILYNGRHIPISRTYHRKLKDAVEIYLSEFL